MELTKELIIGLATKGSWLDYYTNEYITFADLDGKHAAEYLKSKGFEIEKYYDTGRNGLAITKDHIYLSTNGYLSKR